MIRPSRARRALHADRLAAEQRDSNRGVAGRGDLYGHHRERLTEELTALASGGDERLALLGAGNCQDVDLACLLAAYREVHLVDLDRTALDRAYNAQSAAVRARLRRHAPIDLSGMLPRLASWKSRSPRPDALAAAVASAVDGIAVALPGPFDTVASCCVMTQMSRSVTEILGPGHPCAVDVREALFTIHLRTLIELLRPGGRALLATDLVSSETYPIEERLAESGPDKVLLELVTSRNFFIGADPLLTARVLRRDPLLRIRAGRPRALRPWAWQAGPGYTFLVTASVIERRSGEVLPS